ncbi:MAG: hypothetical protein Q9208_003865 [Pyrenodesmia sp. 3 TL-2023]
MEPETYQKFGRGGAGNYYSKQDIQEVQKRAASDVEAQQPTNERGAEATPATTEFVHSGRGGAGNYSSASDVAERKRSVDMTPSTRERTVPEGGFYGRGGAGNLRGAAEGEAREGVEASQKQKQAYYEKAVEDVEQGLRAPEKAHLANE